MGNIFKRKQVNSPDPSPAENVGKTGDVFEGRLFTNPHSSTAEDGGDKADSGPEADMYEDIRKYLRQGDLLQEKDVKYRVKHYCHYDYAQSRDRYQFLPAYVYYLIFNAEYSPPPSDAINSASLVHETDVPQFSVPPVPPVTSAPLEHRTNILQSAGMYEVELNWQGESELHKFKQNCQKHPNHEQFIPVSEFAEKHLPALYRNNLIIDLVNCLSALTVRLRVDKISLSRPNPPYPPNPRFDNFGTDCSMNGTGHVSSTVVCLGGANNSEGADNSEGSDNSEGADNLCACTECLESGIPVREFGKIFIQTAAHVVHDDTEAANTTCFFNYVNDNDGLDTVIKIQGTKGVQTDVTEDRCWMFCYTHDLSLVKKLKYMTEKYQNLRKEVSDKYCVNWSDEPEEKLTIIVSHPHGCSKYVTIGNMEGRLAAQDDEDWTQYTYTTPTCPGSSGAPIFMLGKHGYLDNHHHSGTVPDTGLNVSTFGLF